MKYSRKGRQKYLPIDYSKATLKAHEWKTCLDINLLGHYNLEADVMPAFKKMNTLILETLSLAPESLAIGRV